MPVPPNSVMESSGSSTTSSKAGEQVAAAATTSGGKVPKSPKVCGVCGDRAKSYHFGGISCDSCKAFFRRSVQNDAHRNFQCPYDQRCDINVSSRKCCQYCRFQKCLTIGMEKSWVMTEEERLQLLRQRMERKAKQASPGGGPPPGGPAAAAATRYVPDPNDLPQYVGGGNQVALLRELVDKYETSYAAISYPPQLMMVTSRSEYTVLEWIAVLITIIKRMTHFAGSLDALSRLSESDRATLLRCGMIELCLIRAAYAYDPVQRCWPDTSKPLYRNSPRFPAEGLLKVLPPDVHAMHVKFNADLQALDLDETTFMLLIMVVMLSSERQGLQNPQLVCQMQESYLLLLQRYMDWRHSPVEASRLFPKVLLKLTDLRELSDCHIQAHLLFTQGDIEEFQRQFGAILEGQSSEHPGEAAAAVPWPQLHFEEHQAPQPIVQQPFTSAEVQRSHYPLPRQALPEPQETLGPPVFDPGHHLLLRPHHLLSAPPTERMPPPPRKVHPRKPP